MVSAAKFSEDDYVKEILRLADIEEAPHWTPETFSKSPTATPKVFYRSLHGEHRINSIQDLIIQALKDQESATRAVCVIENICPEYIQAVGCAWNLNPRFFIAHSTNPTRRELWITKSPFTQDVAGANMPTLPYTHLDGIFEYHGWEKQFASDPMSSPNFFERHCFEVAPYPIQSNTRISYYSVHSKFYLILVDAPLALNGCKKTRPRSRTTLRLLYSFNRGGVVLPQLFPRSGYSLRENFESMFQHSWHLTWLLGDYCDKFDPDFRLVPAHVMLYFLCSSLWDTNLRWLDGNIKRLSFDEIRQPSRHLNDVLHDRREDLAQLRSAVVETTTYIHETLELHLEQQLQPYKRTRMTNFSPVQNLKRIRDDAEQLEKFVMDTFQLLMSSISVEDSHLSIEQGRRGAWLTQLAFIYLPLSFVTSIFGMNLTEINDSLLSAWVCIVTMAVVAVCTVVVFAVIKLYGQRKLERQQKANYDQV